MSYTSKEYLEQLANDPELKWAHESLNSTGRLSTGSELKVRNKALQIFKSRGIKYRD